jgi:site-specific DNA-methyltransferase (adenine-specific)
MKLQVISLDKIKTNPSNPRIISKDKIKLVKSIKEFPQMLEIRPIVLDADMVVLGGNMRIKACKKAGIKEVPVVFADNLSEKQKKEFIIKDNTAFGEWDADALANWDYDLLGDWGLDIEFAHPSTRRHIDQDDVPLVDDTKIISKHGDIWQMGIHKLMCGDSTNPKDMDKLMGGERANMVWTDPPYNVKVNGAAGSIKNDDMSDGDFKSFLAATYSTLISHMCDGAVIYVSHSETECVNFIREFTRTGFKLSQKLIWNKQKATFGRQDYQWKHESIIFGWKLGKAHYFVNDFTQTTVFNFDKPNASELHPTMKPVGLVQQLIENSSKSGWLVLDTFAGSGSTLIACVNSNRRCKLMELDPKFVDVIIRRWQEYTGEKALNLTREVQVD